MIVCQIFFAVLFYKVFIFTEGIQLTAYQRLGTIHIPRSVMPRRSGSDLGEVSRVDSTPSETLSVPKESTLK